MISIRTVGALTICLASCQCASTGDRKPILTAAATRQIASACGAVAGQLHGSKKPLPYADFTLPGAEGGGEALLRATVVSCLAQRMPKYRYDFYGFH